MKNNPLSKMMVLIALLTLAIIPVKAKDIKIDTRDQMVNASLDSNGNLLIAPSKTSAATDFDFFVGKWTVSNEKLLSRLTHNTQWKIFPAINVLNKVLLGAGNVDHFYAKIDGKDFEGMTVRLFDPKTKLWSLYWADSNGGKFEAPMVGSFENHIGRFYAKDIWNSKPIIVTFKWDATNPKKPVWSQAFSTDNGKTWEWNWYMHFSRTDN